MSDIYLPVLLGATAGDDNDSDDDDDDDDIVVIIPNVSRPNEEPDPKYTDSLVAKQMAKLSREDREKVYFDLHGVSEQVVETPELIRKSLSELDKELEQLSNKEAYDAAVSLNAEYVANEKFRLQWLRADLFDAKAAALRLARHFQAKLELFGRDKLGRDIVQDDLGESDMQALYCGRSQTLPFRDRAGRAIAVLFPQIKLHISNEAKLRRMFYASMVMAEDEETQTKGCVSVVYSFGKKEGGRAFDSEGIRKLAGLTKAIPLRMVAFHVCHDSLLLAAGISILKMSVSWFTKLRIRSHYGSQSDCLYNLQTFGIPSEILPIDDKGNMIPDLNQIMWEKRRKHERMVHKGGRVGVPSRNDVLLGRGRGLFQHVGNLRYRTLIDNVTDVHATASVTKKTQLTWEIVDAVKKTSGRFLKDDGAGWVVVKNEVARLKVSHAFRTFRRLKAESKASSGGKLEEGESSKVRPDMDDIDEHDAPSAKRPRIGSHCT